LLTVDQLMRNLTYSSALLYVITASILSFFAGRVTRSYIFNKEPRKSAPVLQHAQHTPDSIPAVSSHKNKKHPMNAKNSDLPAPRLIEGKKVPKTKYTSMIFNEVHVASEKYSSLHLEDISSSVVVDSFNIRDSRDSKEQVESLEEECVATSDGNTRGFIDNIDEEDYVASYETELKTKEDGKDEDLKDGVDNENDDDDDEDHLPAGQHLLVDIEQVNSAFLNSEVRLAEAMVNVINESKLTLLSYHCHKLIPMGVSCVGVLLESHISFHTWPEVGVITLDLYTCGNGELIPVLPVIERLFAIPRDGVGPDADLRSKPRTVWTHKLRGFRDEESGNHLSADLGEMVLEVSSYELKKEIVSVQSAFQRIDIYDTILKGDQDISTYERSLLQDGSYESRHPQFFEPNRLVFLDGKLQSTREGNEAYHEALVHPAMFYHPDPKRVAIIGGGEGSTLREVLKHNTLETVTMIEIDQVMVDVSKQYLPDWNDCSDLVGSAKWCGYDERAEIKYVDAFKWFNDRFSTLAKTTQEEPFDVIIMDAL